MKTKIHSRGRNTKPVLDAAQSIFFERQLEQCVRVADSHAGYDGFFACHVALVSGLSRPRRPHRRERPAQALGIRRDFGIREIAECPRAPRKSRRS